MDPVNFKDPVLLPIGGQKSLLENKELTQFYFSPRPSHLIEETPLISMWIPQAGDSTGALQNWMQRDNITKQYSVVHKIQELLTWEGHIIYN